MADVLSRLGIELHPEAEPSTVAMSTSENALSEYEKDLATMMSESEHHAFKATADTSVQFCSSELATAIPVFRQVATDGMAIDWSAFKADGKDNLDAPLAADQMVHNENDEMPAKEHTAMEKLFELYDDIANLEAVADEWNEQYEEDYLFNYS